jgi:hypothetical protein
LLGHRLTDRQVDRQILLRPEKGEMEVWSIINEKPPPHSERHTSIW